MSTKLVYDINKSELNLDKTLDCGQAFRWDRQMINNEKHWVGVINGEVWILKQSDDKIETNLDYEDIVKFVRYFNLDLDYTTEIGKIDLNEFEKKSYKFSEGIHILRQDLLETMITFLMSSCNTMSNIRNIVNKMSKLYGTEIITEFKGETIVRYSFPTLEKLKTLTEEDFKKCGMGFRARYLVNMVKQLNESYLKQLKQMDYKSSMKMLQEFKGVGVKVANCVALFGLHHIQAFPIDTHIQQIIDKEFNGKINIQKYGQYAGIIQQYMFYYKAFN